MLELIKSSVREFMDDDCTTMAAALSYYTVFSLPPLLLLILLYQSRVAFNICKENRGKLAIGWHDLLVLIKFSDFSKYQSANRSAIIKPNCDN